MFSKALELTGLGLIAWGLAMYLTLPAGVIFAGASLVFVGSTTDDAGAAASARRGLAWARYYWHRQVLRENGIEVPHLQAVRQVPMVVCGCDGDPDCALCGGSGYVPDPDYREDKTSPHPPLRIDPQVAEDARRMARSRQARSELNDRTGALSRQEVLGH